MIRIFKAKLNGEDTCFYTVFFSEVTLGVTLSINGSTDNIVYSQAISDRLIVRIGKQAEEFYIDYHYFTVEERKEVYDCFGNDAELDRYYTTKFNEVAFGLKRIHDDLSGLDKSKWQAYIDELQQKLTQ